MDNSKLKSRMSGKVQELQKTVEVVNTTADTSLAPVNSAYLALTNNALDLIRANLKSQPLTLDLFDIVKSPSGGSTVFSVPGLAGDEPAKELMGIVLDYTTPRAYWNSPDPVEGTPPVCLSQNSIIPLLVRVPATSKPRFLKYSTRLLSTLTPISSVVTKITLEKATSKGGKPYALFNFEAVSTLTSEEADHARTYAKQFMEIVNAAQMVPEMAAAS